MNRKILQIDESLLLPQELTLLLARHGESEANRDKRISGQWDTPLSPRGLEQACSLAEVLADEPLTAIYASDLTRTAATAQLTAQDHGLPVHRLSELNEVHLGELQGRALDGSDPDAERDLAKWESDRYGFYSCGVEDYRQFLSRVLRGLRRIETEATGAVLIVGHRNTNEVIVRTLLGTEALVRLPSPLNIKNKYVYRLERIDATISIVTVRLGGEHHGRRYEGWKQ